MGFRKDRPLVLFCFYVTLKVLHQYLNIKNNTLFLCWTILIGLSGKDVQETDTLSITNLDKIQQFMNNNDLLLNLGKTS